MNSKLFILVVIAVSLNVVYGQLVARRAVARGGLVGGARVWGTHLGLAGGYGYGNLGYGNQGLGYGLGYGGYGGYGLAGPALGYGYGGYGGYGVARVAAPAIGAIGVAAPAAIGVAHAPAVGIAGLGLGLGLRGRAVAHQHIGPVSAAIETIRTAQVVDVPTSQDVITPTNLIVEPNILPVNIEFRSQSSPVNVNQVHIPGRPGEVRHTNSEEEADRLVHEVVKPVIQEVRETIVPFRRITQEVLPVQEEVHSLVARGQRQQVLAAPQVVAQPVAARVAVAAPRVAVAAPAVGVAGLAVAHRPAGIAVAAPVGIGGVVAPVATGVVAPFGVAHTDLVTTGIARFGGALGGIGGGVIPIRARS